MKNFIIKNIIAIVLTIIIIIVSLLIFKVWGIPREDFAYCLAVFAIFMNITDTVEKWID